MANFLPVEVGLGYVGEASPLALSGFAGTMMSQLTLVVEAVAVTADVADGLADAEALPDGLASADRPRDRLVDLRCMASRDSQDDPKAGPTSSEWRGGSQYAPHDSYLRDGAMRTVAREHSIHLHMGVRGDAPGG